MSSLENPTAQTDNTPNSEVLKSNLKLMLRMLEIINKCPHCKEELHR